MTQSKRGLILVYTGNGKGKTTAALGAAFRAMGYEWKTCIIQFMKGTWHYGELDAVKKVSDYIHLNPMGKGFYKILDDNATEEEHRDAAQKALKAAQECMARGDYELIILDEVLVAVNVGILAETELLDFLAHKPEKQHLILTGRGATESVKNAADLVTEMTEIKHPYQQGILARKGIDF